MSVAAFRLEWMAPELAFAGIAIAGLAWIATRIKMPGRDNGYVSDKALTRLVAGRQNGSGFGFYLAWLCGVIALGGPTLVTNDTTESLTHVRDVAIIVDISPSMALTDLPPSRLQQVKWKLDRLSQRMPDARLGLIAFSANAYVALPLTQDHDSLTTFSHALEPNMVLRKGSNVQRALTLAQKMLADTPSQSRALVLFSDGDFDDAISLLSPPSSMPLVVYGVGTTQGAPVLDLNGQIMIHDKVPVFSKLQRNVLAPLARNSGGIYIDLQLQNDDDIERGVAYLSTLKANNRLTIPQEKDISLVTPLVLLSVTLFMMINFGFRLPVGNAAVIIIAMIAIGTSDPALANPFSETQAWRALQRGDFEQAAIHYRLVDSFSGRLGLGAATYRLGQWEQALDAFKQAQSAAQTDEQRATAAFNQGNTLAKLERTAEATVAFQQALALAPGHTRAGINLSQLQKLNSAQARSAAIAKPTFDASTQPDTPEGQTICEGSNCTSLTDTAQPIIQARPNQSTSFTPKDSISGLLQQRFARQDYKDALSRVEDRPW